MMIKNNMFSRCLCIALLVSSIVPGCRREEPKNDPVTYGSSFSLTIYTDKAMYKPGEQVLFTLNKALAGNIKIRYRHFSETISEATLSGTNWSWTAPSADYTGYMVDLYEVADGKEKVHASIGVDVSSDWARFPRYGFLTNFSQLSDDEINKVVKNLSRHHINGLQYYDWLYKHHWPMAGTGAAPQSSWKEIANKDVYLSTLKTYIEKGHAANMKSMFYNLAFGALNDAAADGVNEEWYAFKDANHGTKDKHELPKPFFKSDIYVLDAGNTGWQNYIAAKNKDVYTALDFDGYHVDALGDRGSLYNFSGQSINQAATFKPFLEAMKAASPTKRLVMNAVNQYGQQTSISQSPVDFLYTEVWGPNERFEDLANIIRNNDFYGNNAKKTVLAAYLNYNKANNPGMFNTPAVLLADAVIFAFGGSHLELGEHMLGKEYFPNNNLQMSDELKTSLMSYYDFLVAYENLLRDGGSFNLPAISCTNGKLSLESWPAAAGKVAVQGKLIGNRQIFHLLNFSNANSTNWRDTDGTQLKPSLVEDAAIRFTATGAVKKIWLASPDADRGVARTLQFVQSGNDVSFTLPSILYWDMLVVEY
ncbi:glycoside hydrolase family 66 protein [Terrimonas sp. NA20]|uniref:Glycoside hydrolase family 66 protein n=1 Tax=Terrimonas ginsenosidimutans TaxID=2908004 RepID=A0ABS9KS15_9BACT|nr:glycoside hydrolase family 66 protein [Terrimonas ginsenosidimutans]MCG2615111.1 glycoside hydrolase family 66 protein [Terrimonas ginsenosidimutans]